MKTLLTVLSTLIIILPLFILLPEVEAGKKCKGSEWVLSALDRFFIPQLKPARGTYNDLAPWYELIEKVKLSSDELDLLAKKDKEGRPVKDMSGQTIYSFGEDGKQTKVVDITICLTSLEVSVIRSALEKLDEGGNLTHSALPLFRKFVKNEGE